MAPRMRVTSLTADLRCPGWRAPALPEYTPAAPPPPAPALSPCRGPQGASTMRSTPKEVQTMTSAQPDLTKYVEGGGVFVIRGSGNCRSWNGIQYRPGLSAKNVPAQKLSMNVATIPPGGVAYAHVHVGFEVMLYILQGRVRHEYGAGLKRTIDNQAGDFIYIEAGV